MFKTWILIFLGIGAYIGMTLLTFFVLNKIDQYGLDNKQLAIAWPFLVVLTPVFLIFLAGKGLFKIMDMIKKYDEERTHG